MIPYGFTAHSQKQLRKLPINVQKQIIKKIEAYLNTPDPLQFAEPLAGRKGKAYRFRIRDHRAIFDWRGDSILITRVGHRKNIYRA